MRRALILLGVLVLASAGTGAWLYQRYDAPGPLAAAQPLVIPHGGLDDVAVALQANHVISSTLLFRIFAIATSPQGPLHSAELAFPEAASLRQVLAILRTARPVQHRLTIPEGLTAAQITALVDNAPALTGDTPVPQEGTLLPQTYNYEYGTTREQIIDRARTAMDRTLQLIWAARAPGLPLTSAAEAVTLASIVERETAKPDERPLIAGVYLNRLRLGMKLQSDPTVIYGASLGLGVLDHGITRAELDAATPYNTYRIDGLPPGPICNPGVASLRAVTQPASTDALYFVADGTGGHVFARTPEQHLRNAARWREIERARSATTPP